MDHFLEDVKKNKTNTFKENSKNDKKDSCTGRRIKACIQGH